MKNNKKHIALNSNIIFEQNLKRNPRQQIIQVIAMYLCLRGCMLAAYLTLGTPNSVIIILTSFIFPLIFGVVFNLKKYQMATIAGCLVLYTAAIWLYLEEIKQALIIFNANFLESVNYYYKTKYSYQTPSFTQTEYLKYTTVFTIAVAFLLAFLLGICIVKLKSTIVTAILLSPFAYLAFMFTNTPHAFTLLILFSGFFMVFSMQCVYFRLQGKKVNEFFSKMKNKKSSKYILHDNQVKSQNVAMSAVIVLGAAIFVLFATQLVVPKDSFESNSKSNNIIENIIERINVFAIDGFGISRASGGIGGGKLGNVDKLVYNNQLHLKVRTDEKTPMFLKGYIGSRYEGNAWHNLYRNEYNKNEELFESFQQARISPQNIGNDFSEFSLKRPDLFKQNGYTSKPTIKVNTTIQNINANQTYVYTPYHFSNSAYQNNHFNGIFINDTIIENKYFGGDTYTVSSYLFMNTGAMDNIEYTPFHNTVISSISALENDYLEHYANMDSVTLEAKYDTFVQDVYTILPKGELIQLKEVARSLVDETETDIHRTIMKIKDYLATQTKYDLEPGKTPKNEDFAEYFLFGNKKGYCTHYATAGALMLRANGIPARYVEGYTVTKEDIKQAGKNGFMEIRDTNAHAWVEVYYPTFGWVPYEMTPGYSGQSVNNQNNEQPDVSSVIEEIEPVSSEVSSEVETPVSSAPSEPTKQETSSVFDVSEPEEAEMQNDQILWLALMIFIPIFILVLFVYLRRTWMIRMRQKGFNQSETNLATIAVYDYIKQQLAFIGYHLSEHSNEQAFALFVEQKCRLIEKDALVFVTELALKARFSNATISKQELSSITEFAMNLNESIYQSLSTIGKLRYRYEKGLK